MRAFLLIVAALLLPAAAAAQAVRATSTLTVDSALNVTSGAPVRLKTTVIAPGDAEGAPQADATAVVMLGGDPNRVYRVRIPTASAAGVARAYRILSANGGDISESGVSHLDGEGRDRLEITGLDDLLLEAGGEASFPLSIVYE